MILRHWLLLKAAALCCFLTSTTVHAQDCVGGQIYTTDTHLYGRFEVSMRSAGVSGVISSFFLYNLDIGCDWPDENNEIDIEMTGNSENLLFTTHYPGPWYVTDTYTPPFNPHDSLHAYAIEWEPGIVRWFVHDSLIVTQNHAAIEELIHPMRVVMNLWAVDNVSWAGPWDPASMPLNTTYDYVRCYTYTPGTGTHGTNNDYTLKWEDDFSTLDTTRWVVEEFGGFGGNYCSFESSAVRVDSGLLFLEIEEPQEYPLVPVTFSVDLSEQSMDANDKIYLNGGFNNWCGTCTPMEEQTADVWTTTVSLQPGKYEYLFTKNAWEENGGAPYQSECDFNPCDEWLNYGLVVPIGSDAIALPVVCWNACDACAPLSTAFPSASSARELEGIYDLTGRPVDQDFIGVQVRWYSDGTFQKVVKMQ